MNFLKKFIGAASTDEVVSLPSGKLFLTRSPHSPKGELECLYNDAFASIRQTTSSFYYRLLITRVYQEGELSSSGDGGFDDLDEEYDGNGNLHDLQHASDSPSGVGHSKDEYGFVIVEDLKIHLYDKEDGSKAISWKDMNGDLGDRFEFVIDQYCKTSDIDAFMFALYKCQYEQKYHKSSLNITSMAQLKEFVYNPKTELLTFEDLNKDWDEDDDDDGEGDEDEEEADVEDEEEDEVDSTDSETEFHDADATSSRYSSKKTNLFIFNPETESFDLLVELPSVSILETGQFQFRLLIKGGSNKDKGIISGASFAIDINNEINPTFNVEFLSFIFHFQTNKVLNTYLLKFENLSLFHEFQKQFSTSLFEVYNKQKAPTSSEIDFITDAFGKTNLEDRYTEGELREIEEMDESEDDEEDEEEEEEESSRPRKLFVDSDSDNDSDNNDKQAYSKFKKNAKNSSLSVGTSNDLSYVVRGSNLGVFRTEGDGSDEESFKFKTAISNLTTLDGKQFIPKKALLHMQDRQMIMQSSDPAQESTLFKMDLERGKVIEEWEVSKDQQLKHFGPNNKFSQLTNEQTLTGISANGLFKIDPRLHSKEKMVLDDSLKLYKTKNNGFLSFATTQEGFIAVASTRGDLRLYDRLGVNAKSQLPSLGEGINHVDVSADGRWILGTCKSHLLLIDTKIGDGQRNAGLLGFQKAFDKDKKPKPRILRLKPEHVAFIFNETGESICFTKAHFDTGLSSKESTIATSTGKFTITWSLKDILKPSSKKKNGVDSPDYRIEKNPEVVIADNFKFGSNANVILALQDDVTMTNKKSFKRPNKSFFVSGNSVVEEY